MPLTKDRKGNLIEYLFYSLQVRENLIFDPDLLCTRDRIRLTNFIALRL